MGLGQSKHAQSPTFHAGQVGVRSALHQVEPDGPSKGLG